MNISKKERPKHLGRGLESLIGPIKNDELREERSERLLNEPENSYNYPPDKELHDSFLYLDINEISPNPYQARMVWNDEELSILSESIKANGVVQPIVVRQIENGFQIIAGERRFRATKMASLKTIPALIRKASDEQLHEWSLVENIHRVDLNPIERAKAYRDYLNTFSLTQTSAAERLGEDRSVVANYMRLLDLPKEIQQMLIDSKLSMGHARAILALPTDDLRRKLANRAMAGRLSVREVEKLVRKYLTGNEISRKTDKEKPPHIQDLERKLESELKTKVSIETKKNGQKGKIIIEFYSLDEFDGITEKLGINSNE